MITENTQILLFSHSVNALLKDFYIIIQRSNISLHIVCYLLTRRITNSRSCNEDNMNSIWSHFNIILSMYQRIYIYIYIYIYILAPSPFLRQKLIKLKLFVDNTLWSEKCRFHSLPHFYFQFLKLLTFKNNI